MSTLKVTNIQATGETATRAVSGIAAAWVNFNGTGTIAARNSTNISSLTDNGTGRFATSFTNTFSTSDYTQSGGHGNGGYGTATGLYTRGFVDSVTTSSCGIGAFYDQSASTGPQDNAYMSVTYHGDLA